MMHGRSFDDLRRLHRQAIAHAAGIAVDELGRPQTLVVGEPERAGSDIAVAYHIGKATVVRCDPDLRPVLAPLADPEQSVDPEASASRSAELGLTFVNGGDQRIVPVAGLVDQPRPEGARWGRYTVRALCDLMVAADRVPIYRNNWDRPASAALARSIGFRLVARLTAVGSQPAD